MINDLDLISDFKSPRLVKDKNSKSIEDLKKNNENILNNHNNRLD